MQGAKWGVLPALVALALCGTVERGVAQEEDEPEVTLDVEAIAIELSGRVQVQAATSSCSDAPFGADSPCTTQVPGLDMFTRRVRFTAGVTINDFISAEVQPDYGEVDGVELKDAWGRLTFSDGAKVQIGHFKRPFDGFQLTSSTRILTIERDVDVPGVPSDRALSFDELTTGASLSDRDVGAMFFGTAGDGRWEYYVGGFNGEPSGASDERNGEKQLVGRVVRNLEVEGLPLSVAGAVALTDLAFRGADDRPGAQVDAEYYADVEVFAELGDYTPGPHLQAGLVFGENPLQAEDGGSPLPPEPAPPDVDREVRDLASMSTWQMVGAWRFPVEATEYVESVEPALRVTRSDPNTGLDDDAAWGFTPGVNVYFHGRNRLQLNWDFATFPGDAFDSVNSFKTQFQVYF